MVSKKERLMIEIELLEWLFEKTKTTAFQEHYFYSFSYGVLEEKRLKLRNSERRAKLENLLHQRG